MTVQFIEMLKPQEIVSRYQPIVAFAYDDIVVHTHPSGWGSRRCPSCDGCRMKGEYEKAVAKVRV